MCPPRSCPSALATALTCTASRKGELSVGVDQPCANSAVLQPVCWVTHNSLLNHHRTSSCTAHCCSLSPACADRLPNSQVPADHRRHRRAAHAGLRGALGRRRAAALHHGRAAGRAVAARHRPAVPRQRPQVEGEHLFIPSNASQSIMQESQPACQHHTAADG